MTGIKFSSFKPHWLILALVLGGALILGLVLAWPERADASQPSSGSLAPGSAPQLTNADCLLCHSKPGFNVPLADGEKLPLTIDPTQYGASVHGSKNMSCTTCHVDITEFPHPKRTAESLREYAVQMRDTCKTCHNEQYQLTMDSVHQKAFESGNQQAPTCADCHNPHTQGRITDAKTGQILPAARLNIPQVCARCHNAIYNEYKESVHGAALIDANNTDVPTCIDCHGVHRIPNPTTPAFRINSPQICSKCHTDKALMSKYGISTDVLRTYVADFHGTTATLFQKLSPDQPTNTPVCFDCHGVHNITRVDDPVNGLQLKQNLLATCQKCHPNAGTNFPTAWMGHYIADPKRTPLVYYVQLFYKILIPLVLGGMVLFVASDVYRRLKDRRKGGSQA
jgi:nitrate/TMAO reductase-like tetraheme cytochrome c subunit